LWFFCHSNQEPYPFIPCPHPEPISYSPHHKSRPLPFASSQLNPFPGFPRQTHRHAINQTSPSRTPSLNLLPPYRSTRACILETYRTRHMHASLREKSPAEYDLYPASVLSFSSHLPAPARRRYQSETIT
jgi:hypothetical protein